MGQRTKEGAYFDYYSDYYAHFALAKLPLSAVDYATAVQAQMCHFVATRQTERIYGLMKKYLC